MSVPPSVNFGTDSAAPAKKALYLVCGLGGLGQYCASILIEFGVRVYGISAAYPSDWEVPDLPERAECPTGCPSERNYHGVLPHPDWGTETEALASTPPTPLD